MFEKLLSFFFSPVEKPAPEKNLADRADITVAANATEISFYAATAEAGQWMKAAFPEKLDTHYATFTPYASLTFQLPQDGQAVHDFKESANARGFIIQY